MSNSMLGLFFCHQSSDICIFIYSLMVIHSKGQLWSYVNLPFVSISSVLIGVTGGGKLSK